jgi:hypothetical protein
MSSVLIPLTALNTQHKHPCPRRDSNPQPSGRRSKPLNTRPPGTTWLSPTSSGTPRRTYSPPSAPDQVTWSAQPTTTSPSAKVTLARTGKEAVWQSHSRYGCCVDKNKLSPQRKRSRHSDGDYGKVVSGLLGSITVKSFLINRRGMRCGVGCMKSIMHAPYCMKSIIRAPYCLKAIYTCTTLHKNQSYVHHIAWNQLYVHHTACRQLYVHHIILNQLHVHHIIWNQLYEHHLASRKL